MAPAQRKNRRHRRNINEPGHAHELTFSCYRQFPFLSRKRTRQWLVDSIEHARRSLQFDVWAWVFMPDHVHLVVHPHLREYDMAVVRRLIKEPVAKRAVAWMRENAPEWLSRMERRQGARKEHLFWQSGGGYDRNITEAETLFEMIDYIHENPVRRGLVTRARDWEWSSAAWYEDQSQTPLVPDPIPLVWLGDTKLGL